MTILLLTHYFAPENAAPQRRWDGIGRELVAAGHEVHVICPPPHYPLGRVLPEHARAHAPGRTERTAWGGIVHRSAYLPHGSGILSRTVDHLVAAGSSLVLAQRRLGRRRPDVIIATAPGTPTIIAGRLLGWRWMVPVVVEMRDAWPDLVTHTPGLAAGRGPVAMAKRFIHSEMSDWQRRAAHVVTTTQRFADVLEGRGMPRPTVIRNGTAVELYEQIPHDPPPSQPDQGAGPGRSSRYTAAPDEGPHEPTGATAFRPAPQPRPLHALYMGNLGRSQGLDVAVRAAARLRDAGVGIRLRIVGYGAEAGALRALNARLGHPAEILDAVTPNEVAAHYTWADTTIVSLRDWAPLSGRCPRSSTSCSRWVGTSPASSAARARASSPRPARGTSSGPATRRGSRRSGRCSRRTRMPRGSGRPAASGCASTSRTRPSRASTSGCSTRCSIARRSTRRTAAPASQPGISRGACGDSGSRDVRLPASAPRSRRRRSGSARLLNHLSWGCAPPQPPECGGLRRYAEGSSSPRRRSRSRSTRMIAEATSPPRIVSRERSTKSVSQSLERLRFVAPIASGVTKVSATP